MTHALPSPDSEPVLLVTTPEVAKLCSVSERTINNWVRERGFPVIRIGRAVRFDPVSVRVWLRRHQSGAVTEEVPS